MKKLIFVCSHLYSGSRDFCKILNENPKIQLCSNFEKQTYESPLDLFQATSAPHKLKNKSAIYLDHLLYNYQLSMKAAYSYCRFIYVVRNPEPVINQLMNNDQMSFSQAERYYNYRLRRLYELSKNTPEAILFTWDDLKTENFSYLLQDYLGLSEPLYLDKEKNYKFCESDCTSFNYDFSDVENKYQKYLYFMKKQNLIVT